MFIRRFPPQQKMIALFPIYSPPRPHPHPSIPMCLQWLLVARAGVGFGLSGSFTQYTLFMEWLPHRSRGMWLVLFNAW